MVKQKTFTRFLLMKVICSPTYRHFPGIKLQKAGVCVTKYGRPRNKLALFPVTPLHLVPGEGRHALWCAARHLF